MHDERLRRRGRVWPALSHVGTAGGRTRVVVGREHAGQTCAAPGHEEEDDIGYSSGRPAACEQRIGLQTGCRQGGTAINCSAHHILRAPYSILRNSPLLCRALESRFQRCESPCSAASNGLYYWMYQLHTGTRYALSARSMSPVRHRSACAVLCLWKKAARHLLREVVFAALAELPLMGEVAAIPLERVSEGSLPSAISPT